MTREAQKQRSMTGIMKRTYNKFSSLENEIECSISNNFGHEDSECRSRFRQATLNDPTSLNPKTWKKKEPQPERCGIALYVEGQENQWYIDSGCSKHMTGKTVIKGIRTPNNLYIFKEGEQQFYLSKNDEHWLWHRILGHLSFSQIRKACKYQDVLDRTYEHKDEAFEKFKSFKSLVENESDRRIKCLKSDRGGEFTSDEFFYFCEEHGIRREFSATRTPKKNGVVERMNRMVQQMARAMLDESGTPVTFWGEAAFAAITIRNKTKIRVNNTQTPHELWYGKTPTVKYFKIFGSKCYIKKTDENLGKFEPIADEGILLGYSPHSKAYKCYNKRLGKIVESIDVVVDEEGKSPRQVKYENIEDDEDYPSTSNQIHDEEETREVLEEHIRIEEKTPSRYVQKNHPKTQILGQKEAGVQTRRTISEALSYLALLSSTEPQNVKEACKDECWVMAMEEELE
eukprot:PITA_14520